MRPFELSWLGGPAEAHHRRHCPAVDAMPWGTLDPTDFDPALVDRARLAWTQGAFSEYATGAALASLQAALLRVGAPVDLVGMAGVFVADEMLHAELNARMAMELGGAAPARASYEHMVPTVGTDDPLLAAVELAVRIGCVSEAVSSPMLAATARAATHPLSRAVLMQIARDEPPHALFGWLVLEWASPQLNPAARAHLGRAASEQLRQLADGLVAAPRTAPAGVTDLGWLPGDAYLALVKRVIQNDVVDRLAAYDVVARSPISLTD